MIGFFENMRAKKNMDVTVQNYFPILQKWVGRMIHNKKVVESKRVELETYFNRELEIMCAFYRIPKNFKKNKNKKQFIEMLNKIRHGND